MAKDPAFLFYSSDFLTGVAGLTMEERGQYITLLCLQHQKGHLSEKTIRIALGIDTVSQIRDVIQKFVIDENGLYFNRRLEVEVENRRKPADASRENGKLGGRPIEEKPSNNLGVKNRLTQNKPRNNLSVNEDESGDIDTYTDGEKTINLKYSDYVSMTEDEYKALVAKTGEQGAKRCIEILDNYKGATGKEYKSDYRAILNWVIDRWQREGGNASAEQFPDFD